jgi:YegS/Rv2252/BmrU family lipid kinase
MNYVQLIYNPVAGQKIFKTRLDYMIEKIQNAGYELRIHRTTSNDDFSNFFEKRSMENCEAIIVAGGDGSFNRTVNALKKNNLNIPVGIIPAGTANDYARHIGIPDNLQDAINIVSKMESKRLDLGIANNQYFVNVCSGGLLTNISHDIDTELKNTLGKLAYYIKGVQQLPKFRSLKFRITTREKVHEEELFLFLVLNGSSAGGFMRIGEYASMKDGLLDFVGIKSCPVNDIAIVFRKILMGEHLEDKNILFFQTDYVLIECLEEEKIASDLDGEKGPEYPIEIKVEADALKVIVNNYLV